MIPIFYYSKKYFTKNENLNRNLNSFVYENGKLSIDSLDLLILSGTLLGSIFLVGKYGLSLKFFNSIQVEKKAI
jgi:hypothetical protein